MYNDELMTIRDVARMTKYTPRSVYSLVYKREIPFIKLNGKGLRFVRSDIEAWINSFRTGAQPERSSDMNTS